ncbi:MAG: thioredoxin [Candidatus Nealsonbacteria bacterium]
MPEELNLTDENFDEVMQNAEKPILVDFWAQWCGPCTILGPILEKVAQDYKDKFILAKANLDDVPNLAQKFGIDQIPTVLLFKAGKPVSGFIGVQPEQAIREMLDKMLKDSSGSSDQNELEKEIQEYQQYADQNGLKLNPDRKMVENLVRGLLANEKKHGARYCPCRRMVLCPCQSSKEEIEKDGHCHCGLFVK